MRRSSRPNPTQRFTEAQLTGPPDDPDLAWSRRFRRPVRAIEVRDDVAYVTSGDDGDGQLAAFDLDGQGLWSVFADSDPGAVPVCSGETVYFTHGSTISAVDAHDGTERWRWTVGSSESVPPDPEPGFLSTVLVASSELFVTEGADIAAPCQLSAVSLDDGESVWQRSGFGLPSAPASDGTSVFYTSVADVVEEGFVVAVDADSGAEEWTFHTESDLLTSPPTVADGTVYVTGSSPEGSVYAIDAATGTERWRQRYGDSPAGAIAPAVADGTVYAAGGHIALDAATGKTQWRRDPSESKPVPPAVAEGVVYVAAGAEEVAALDAATGAERWRIDVGAAPTSLVVSNGALWLGTDDGQLSVYGDPRPVGSETEIYR